MNAPMQYGVRVQSAPFSVTNDRCAWIYDRLNYENPPTAYIRAKPEREQVDLPLNV